LEPTLLGLFKNGARLSQPQHPQACSRSERSGAVLPLHVLRLVEDDTAALRILKNTLLGLLVHHKNRFGAEIPQSERLA
jgi:hypothetical protein